MRLLTRALACSVVAHYSMQQLPFLPEVISPSGVVAGTDEVSRPIMWTARTGVRKLPVPKGFHSAEPVAITASGQIVVDAFDAQHRNRGAFVYSGSSPAALPGEQTFVHGASPSGLVLGEWVPAGEARAQAVYWSNNVPHVLELCCGGTLKAANRSGVMVGEAYDEQGQYHAFAWDGPLRKPRLIVPDRYSAAIAINNSGDILIQAGREVYLEHGGQLRALQLAPGTVNTARSMNNCGVIVGGYGPDSDRYRGFLWSATGGFHDVNSLIPPDSGWTIQDALAINDRGEIIGKSTRHREEAGFVLTPVAH
jgi:uncharacterized membrane protein